MIASASLSRSICFCRICSLSASVIRARWPGRFCFRGCGEDDLWRFVELEGEGDRLLESERPSSRFVVEVDGDRDLLRFLAGSSFVALKG